MATVVSEDRANFVWSCFDLVNNLIPIAFGICQGVSLLTDGDGLAMLRDASIGWHLSVVNWMKKQCGLVEHAFNANWTTIVDLFRPHHLKAQPGLTRFAETTETTFVTHACFTGFSFYGVQSVQPRGNDKSPTRRSQLWNNSSRSRLVKLFRLTRHADPCDSIYLRFLSQGKVSTTFSLEQGAYDRLLLIFCEHRRTPPDATLKFRLRTELAG